MGKKFYAVRKGLVPGIYTTWDECRSQVHGFPGAIFKGFETREEAELFFADSSDVKDSKKARPEEKERSCTGGGEGALCSCEENLLSRPKSEAVAYVDGSFDAANREFSYGIVMFARGEEIHFAEKCSDEDVVEMRNVAGEILGAQKAMEYCVEEGIASLDIYHDYEGIAKWCLGIWKTNKVGTQRYKKFYDSVKDRLSVNFYKVTAHTGDEYNELADKLAKGALGLK